MKRISLTLSFSLLLSLTFSACQMKPPNRIKKEKINFYKANSPSFRIGLEIETCFKGKEKNTYPRRDRAPIHQCKRDHSLKAFKFFPEMKELFDAQTDYSISCPEEIEGCPGELSFTEDKEFYSDGSKFYIKEGKAFEDAENKFLNFYRIMIAKGASRCGSTYKGKYTEEASSCGTHLHVSFPEMEKESLWKKNIFKLYVFALWLEKYQKLFLRKNLTRNYKFKAGYNHKDDAYPDMHYGKVLMVKEKAKFPTLEALSKIKKEDITKQVEKLPSRKNTNLKLILPSRFGNNYPHFEFRGHDDLFKLLEEKAQGAELTAEDVYKQLSLYTQNIKELTDEAIEMTRKKVKDLE